MIVVPGLGSGKADLLPVAEAMWRGGHAVLIFDPRAHGQSGGQLTSFGDRERLDVLAALRWLRATRPERCESVYGLGVSMGGAALIAAAAEGPDRFDAVAVIDTFADLEQVADGLVRRQFARSSPVRLLAGWLTLPLASVHAGLDLADFRPADRVAKLWPAPVFVAHSRGDAIIPFVQGTQLFAAAEEPKRSLWVEQLGHPEVMVDSYVLSSVARFFADAEGWRPVVSREVGAEEVGGGQSPEARSLRVLPTSHLPRSHLLPFTPPSRPPPSS